MKKLVLILIGIIFITGCGKMTTYETINSNKLNEMISNKESFILYIGSSECSHCKLFSITLNEVISENQVKVYYINIVNFNDKAITDLKTKTTFNGGTPFVVFMKLGKPNIGSGYNIISGQQSKDYVIDKFTNNGYIK